MRLIGFRNKPIGPQCDIVDDPVELGSQGKVETKAGCADHKVKSEPIPLCRNRDRVARPLDFLPIIVGVSVKPRLPTCVIEGVGRRRLVVQIEMLSWSGSP